jgi:hypothetical protein
MKTCLLLWNAVFRYGMGAVTAAAVAHTFLGCIKMENDLVRLRKLPLMRGVKQFIISISERSERTAAVYLDSEAAS